MLVVLVMVVLQNSVVDAKFNEFDISASNFGDLADHNRNCSALLDDEVAVVYCESGFFAIDDHDAFFNKETGYSAPTTKIDIFEKPNDVRLDKFITLVDYQGKDVTIIRKSNSEIS